MLTSNYTLKILLVEDDPADAELIEELLTSVSNIQFRLKAVARLGEALNCLREMEFDAILLDLSLPDSFGIDTVNNMKVQAATIPIVVLTALNDENVAFAALRRGAQDYLVKGRLHASLLVRAVQYAIERQRAEEALRQQAERDRLSGRMIERIRSSIDLRDILWNTAAEVRQFLKIDRVLIYRCGSVLELDKNEQEGLIVSMDECLEGCTWNQEVYAGLAMSSLLLKESDTIQAVADIQTTPLDPDYRDLLKNSQIQAFLTVPIWQTSEWQSKGSKRGIYSDFSFSPHHFPHQNTLWGILAAYHCKSARLWQQWEIDFLQHLANQVAVAIQQSELYCQLEIANQKLKLLATTDELTGIANRRQFNRALDSEWRRLAREQAALSLVLCDIDFFKIYNDFYGHPAGDTCLKKVANAIASAVQRPADLVARYGGEEFAIILPYTDTLGATLVTENIHHQIAKLQLSHSQSSISQYVTVSSGIASTIPCSDRSPETLIQWADRALYRAKARGRNRIERAECNF
ncbi:MAG: diguanylate cyclase domain-containing protein [Actinomycetota bacterium]